MIFDIGSSGALPSSRLSTGYQTELLHLDSGFYISVPKDVPLGRPAGENEQHTASQLEEEEVSQDKHASSTPVWAFTVQHSEAGSCRVEAPSNGTVGDLRPDVSKWCGVPAREQRF